MKKKLKVTAAINLSTDVNNQAQFTGKENHQINLQKASELTRAYRDTHPNETIAEFFGKEALLSILNQPGCVGIRIYYGQEPQNGQKHLVLVGAEANQNDIYEGFIAERALACPTRCGINTPLNS